MLKKMKTNSNCRRALRNDGFSLIEMSVVMLILGLLLSGLFVALGDSTSNRRHSDANNEVESIVEAIYGYAQTVGRLPCPAIPNSAGIEDPAGGGDCTSFHGFVPAVTLGIQGATDANNLLLDPWGNPYRYSVSNTTIGIGPDRSFTSEAGMKAMFAQGAVPNNDGLCVARAVACGAPVLTNTAPALVYSMGLDFGYSNSALQNENANALSADGYRMAGNDAFTVSDFVADGANAYDDILVWISPNTLFSRMLTANKLP